MAPATRIESAAASKCSESVSLMVSHIGRGLPVVAPLRLTPAAAVRATHRATDTPSDHGRGLGHFPSCWSLRSIALTREDCTPKFLPGNGRGARVGGSAAPESTILLPFPT